MFNKSFHKNRAVYEIIWTNILESVRPQMTVWRMRFACWISKVTKRLLEYVILPYFSIDNARVIYTKEV